MRGKAIAAVLLLGPATACSGGDTTEGGGDGTPAVSIAPADGTRSARPDRGVTVRAKGGTLGRVSVRLRGVEVPGTLSRDKRTWRSAWTLVPGARYEVSATATSGSGRTATASSVFRTTRAVAATVVNNVVPSQGETVGTGMPVFVQFNKEVPAAARPAVERAVEIRSTVPTEGAWRWLSAGESFNGLPSLVFRPRRPWAPRQTVSVTVHYAGLPIGETVFGARDVTRTFRIGEHHTVDVDAGTHTLVVRENGRIVRTWGVSLGRGGDVRADGVDRLLTTSGVHLTMDRVRVERMRAPGKKKGEPGYYDEKVPWATRISNSGEYIHQNMDDPTCLGRRNCSHGCVRSPAAHAKWFFHWSYRGDIVTVTGTKRPLAWTNGWGYWQLPFETWVQGGALGKSITTERA
ncbi:L,D-transpeptidase [Spirillospora albida]|uniref:L,D-transpeptidase n=1 Tax=Spirillospora albida TaxID=58123 RepID=UPI0004C076DD|nr:Ig-like domain-containing protein [Spirillospora albida]